MLENAEGILKRAVSARALTASMSGVSESYSVSGLTVIYDRGSPDSISVRRQICAGSETKPLELSGGSRSIRSIELSYGSKPTVRGQPVMCVFGRQ